MVWYRTCVVRAIHEALAFEGHRLPDAVVPALKKLWLLMDVATNLGRVALVHNRDYFADADLEGLVLFMVKLDMFFMDPVDGMGETCLRELMLGQRSLAVLGKCLVEGAGGKYKGTLRASLTQLDVLRMWIRYEVVVRPSWGKRSLFGVPSKEIGKGCLEGWGKGTARLRRPDELVLAELVKREIHVEERFIDMLVHGYVDPVTFKDIEEPYIQRAEKRMEMGRQWVVEEKRRRKETMRQEVTGEMDEKSLRRMVTPGGARRQSVSDAVGKRKADMVGILVNRGRRASM